MLISSYHSSSFCFDIFWILTKFSNPSTRNRLRNRFHMFLCLFFFLTYASNKHPLAVENLYFSSKELIMNKPVTITRNEFASKLETLRSVLVSHGYSPILLQAEGALRWLTGKRYQVVDIAPDAPTTVSVLVSVEYEQPSIQFISDSWEKFRVLDIIEEGIWNGMDVDVSYTEAPDIPKNGEILLPGQSSFTQIQREIVTPLAEKTEGNQYAKLQWLIGESRRTLVDSVRMLQEGMNGEDVRNLIYSMYHERGMELNLVLIGLPGMEKHLHPVYDERKQVVKGKLIKLAVGARYCDMFHSASQMVKLDEELSGPESQAYAALRDAALAYADLYRIENDEGMMYEKMGKVFQEAARKHELPGFEKSAFLHHAGGPLSPLGNRDYTLVKGGTRRLIPYSQFAINPIDCLVYTKFEVQGMVRPGREPLIFDDFHQCGEDASNFDVMPFHSQRLRLPKIIIG
jgi:hypothetical protein